MIQNRIHIIGLAATVFAASFAATGAQAQAAAEGHVNLDAQVSQICVLGPPTPAGLALGQISESSGDRVGRLADISDRTIQLPGSFCNYGGAALSISASPLALTEGGPSAGFIGSVNYTCTINAWGTTAATVRTSATNSSGDGVRSISPLPKQADLTLVVSDFAGQSDSLLQPGSYLAVVTITLGPDAGLNASGS